MIVCVCNNVSSSDIDAAIDNGAETMRAVKHETGASTCCGKCQFRVNRLLHDHPKVINDDSMVMAEIK